MRKKTVFLILGTACLSLFSSAAIGFNSRSIQTVKHGSGSSYSSGIQKNEVLDSFDNKRNKVISITNGFDGLLTNEEKILYKKIKSSCNSISSKRLNTGLYSIPPINVSGGCLSLEQIKKVLHALQNDNPEIFWISKIFSCVYSEDKMNIVKFYSIFSKPEKDACEIKLKNKISEIISKIPENSDDYEKELFLHNYIIDNCSYKNVSGNPKIFTSYGCLVDKTAVCEGYSKAMQILLCNCGVECKTVAGIGNGEPHMWNIVKIGGDWYHLDVTWDAADANSRYMYFNVDDKTIKKNHFIGEQFQMSGVFRSNKMYNFDLPKCTAKKYNYYERNSAKISSYNCDEIMIDYIKKSAKLKREYFYFKLDENLSMEMFKSRVFLPKIFSFISKANEFLKNGCKVGTKSLYYSVCSNQNVLFVKVNYI